MVPSGLTTGPPGAQIPACVGVGMTYDRIGPWPEAGTAAIEPRYGPQSPKWPPNAT